MADQVQPLRQPPLPGVATERFSRMFGLAVGIISVALSVIASLATASYMVGKFEGSFEERMKNFASERADLGSKLDSLGVRIDHLNTSSVELTVAITEMRVQTQNTRDALTQERQDRLNEEHDRRMREK